MKIREKREVQNSQTRLHMVTFCEHAQLLYYYESYVNVNWSLQFIIIIREDIELQKAPYLLIEDLSHLFL